MGYPRNPGPLCRLSTSIAPRLGRRSGRLRRLVILASDGPRGALIRIRYCAGRRPDGIIDRLSRLFIASFTPGPRPPNIFASRTVTFSHASPPIEHQSYEAAWTTQWQRFPIRCRQSPSFMRQRQRLPAPLLGRFGKQTPLHDIYGGPDNK